MIDRRNLINPLRWYLAAVFLGLVLSLEVGGHVLQFHVQRLVQLLPALGLLAWCFRPQPPVFFLEPVIGGWYGLGLGGLALTALVGGVLGPIPWISLAFLGLLLLQFSLLPLLRPAWQRHGADTLRMLALFALAVLGIDVGIWLAVTFQGLTPYAYVYWITSQGSLDHVPYLFANARLSNQLSVLLIWSFVPLLQQLQRGDIQRLRWFWWPVCAAIPMLGMAQILFSNGDGAFLAVTAATALMALLGLQDSGVQRRLWWSAASVMLAATLVAALGDVLIGGGRFVGELVERSVREVSEPLESEAMRLTAWVQYLQAALRAPLWGNGIQALPPATALCTPHNLWVGLLHWTGLLGTSFALLLTSAFVPQRWRQLSQLPLAAPVLTALFTYQLVDAIWYRSLALAVLFVVLPGLLPVDDPKLPPQRIQSHRPAFLRWLAFPGVTYRFLALLGILLMVISFVMPEGVKIGLSPLVQLESGAPCWLLF